MGGSSKTESSNKVDPELMALYRQNYTKANEIADLPFQPYAGERVAGFNPAQLQGQNALLGAAADPTAMNAIRGAQGAVGSLMDYHPAAITSPGNLTARGVAAPVIQGGGAITAGIVNAMPVSAGLLRDTDLSPYMNPYLDSVVNSTLADLQRVRDQQRVADNQSAVQAHAFGGSRQGVADALTNEAWMRNVSSTDSGLRSAGYDRAVGAAQADLDRALNAGEFNSGQAYDAQRTNAANRLTADQFNSSQAYNLGLANAANRFSADTYNAGAATATDQYNLNNLLNIAQMNAGNELAGANFRLNAANQYAGLGSSYFNQLAQQGNLYSAVGAQQQALQQAQDDAAYEEFMRQLQYPYQQQQLRNQAVTMMPLQQTQTTKNSSTPGALDIFKAVAPNGLPFPLPFP